MDRYDWHKRFRDRAREIHGDKDTLHNNHYERLGVSRTATAEQIGQAWRTISADIVMGIGGSKISSLRLCHEAYRVLSDPAKRSRYDESLVAVPIPQGSHYQKLNVGVDATPQQIKKAYRAAAKMWHPDVCRRPDADTIFRNIHTAYTVLSCPHQRARYDRQTLA